MTDEHTDFAAQAVEIEGLRAGTKFIKVCVCAHVDSHDPAHDEMFLLHLNRLTTQYESNIVTFDTSNNRDFWRQKDGMISAKKGFVIAYLGWGNLPMQGSADIMAELTIGIEKLKPRLATGTSYTDTDKLVDAQHNRRYLSQIGGQCRNIVEDITAVNFSTLNGTSFQIINASVVAL